MRTLVFLALLYLAWRTLRSKFPTLASSTPPKARESESSEMVQDPHCKVFFPKTEGVLLNDSGTERYFCSEACRDAFLASRTSPRP